MFKGKQNFLQDNLICCKIWLPWKRMGMRKLISYENMTEKPLVYKPLKNLLTESPNCTQIRICVYLHMEGGRLDMIPWIKIYIVYVYYLLTIYGFCVDHFLDTNFFLESWDFLYK